MSYQSNYTRGLWLVICEACGRKYKNTELRQRWDGFMVCEDDWEPRQPQDFVRGVADYQAPPFTRPEQADRFVHFNYSNLEEVSSITTATLIVNISKLKTFIANIVTSAVNILTTYYPKPASNKTLNGNSINSNTLG